MNLKLHKRDIITRVLSAVCCFSISTDFANSVPRSGDLSSPNEQKSVSSTDVQKSISSSYDKSTSDPTNSASSKDVSSLDEQKSASSDSDKIVIKSPCFVPQNSMGSVISISRFEKFCNDLHESCEKYTNFYESNRYDIRQTWWRCIFARFRNGDLPSRMKESYEVFEKEGIHRISCWDSVLAHYHNIITNGILKKHLNDDEIGRLKLGIVTYLIPVSFGLANHTFCYAYLDGYLFIYDVIDGIAHEVIDFNLSYLPGARENIINQIKGVFSRMSYTYMLDKVDNEIERKYYGANAKLREVFRNIGIENGKLAEMETYFSECVLNNDQNVSDMCWMSDVDFLNYLLENSWKKNDRFPPLDCFKEVNPGLMFA